jgi:hypothetical protein
MKQKSNNFFLDMKSGDMNFKKSAVKAVHKLCSKQKTHKKNSGLGKI